MELFVFGLGYSARHFVRTRRRRFQQIAGTVRSEAKAAELRREGIDAVVFAGDSPSPGVAERLSTATALLVSIPPGANDPVLRHFDDRIAASAIEAIVYLSTVGVYGDHGGAWVDETIVPRPTNSRSRERVAAETAWLDLGERSGKIVHVLRLGGIYGPGRSVVEKLHEGKARRLVKPGQVFNRIHVEDIARSIEAALVNRSGGIWNVVDDEPAPPQDVIAYAAALLGVPAPPEIPFENADLPEMTRSFYGENKRVDNSRLVRELGVALAYPTYREGLAALCPRT